MNLNPELKGAERAGSFVVGVALMVYASIGSFDSAAARPVLVVLGMMFVIGGFGGT